MKYKGRCPHCNKKVEVVINEEEYDARIIRQLEGEKMSWEEDYQQLRKEMSEFKGTAKE